MRQGFLGAVALVFVAALVLVPAVVVPVVAIMVLGALWLRRNARVWPRGGRR